MKITTIKTKGQYSSFEHLSTSVETKEGKISASFGEGEPEDMTLGRDLSDAYHIQDMLILAYNAGKNGENLTIEVTEE